MKKIIGGKRYDTEKATCVGSASYSGPGDFRHWREELYRKRTGEFFLYGVGGPASRYAVQIEMNAWAGGDKITPLSYQEAQAWAEKHMDADEYEAVFGTVEELDKVTLALSLPAGVADLLRKEAAKRGRTYSDLAAEAILALLTGAGGKAGSATS